MDEEQGSRHKPVRTTIGDKAAPCPLDHVNRQFRAPAPNMLWVSDFTYVATWAGFVYVAFVIDTYARRIVGRRASRTASSVTGEPSRYRATSDRTRPTSARRPGKAHMQHITAISSNSPDTISDAHQRARTGVNSEPTQRSLPATCKAGHDPCMWLKKLCVRRVCGG